MFRKLLLASTIAALCACSSDSPAPPTADAAEAPAAAPAADNTVTSLSGQQLTAPASLPRQAQLEADLAEARANQAANPDDPDALIWVARRLGYLWRFNEAIAVLDEGVARWPDDARIYRHRGHRYITVRDFPRAQADFEKAAQLIAGKPDEIEPDGAPNPAGIPRTTLAYNIWYHLGLAHYLQGNYAQALDAYQELLKTSAADNDDSIVAVTDWMWMSLMRLGRKDEAAALLEKVTPQMDILENDSYHRRLLMYKGLESADTLLSPESNDTTDIATQGYGVANYYLVNGETEKAKAVLARILEGQGWPAFGYIAAEADMQRLQAAE
ncbi:tetratricopeptide repeat protein [Luteimonas composti]|uniref:Tetratricopeptide repeat protein n=1 Tax=Luteimonas composti TaxID=398257 RepID=A0ABT6MLW2_9GAMM|nr:tetratricopeptide repeat protein [Luteimonas composti]MDH7451583.1 tetratricopeptide repeat protein [Luteimonas composti]